MHARKAAEEGALEAVESEDDSSEDDLAATKPTRSKNSKGFPTGTTGGGGGEGIELMEISSSGSNERKAGHSSAASLRRASVAGPTRQRCSTLTAGLVFLLVSVCFLAGFFGGFLANGSGDATSGDTSTQGAALAASADPS